MSKLLTVAALLVLIVVALGALYVTQGHSECSGSFGEQVDCSAGAALNAVSNGFQDGVEHVQEGPLVLDVLKNVTD